MNTEIKQDKRRHPRYPLKFRVFFLDRDFHAHTANISKGGFFIETTESFEVGTIENLLVELPMVGTVELTGYVHHTRKGNSPGIGVEFVKIRSKDGQEESLNIYNNFLKLAPFIEQLQITYDGFVKNGKLHSKEIP